MKTLPTYANQSYVVTLSTAATITGKLGYDEEVTLLTTEKGGQYVVMAVGDSITVTDDNAIVRPTSFSLASIASAGGGGDQPTTADQLIVTHDPTSVGELTAGAINDLGILGETANFSNISLPSKEGRVPTCELWFTVKDTVPEVTGSPNLVWVDEGSPPVLVANRHYRFGVRVDAGKLIISENYYHLA